MTIIPRLVLIFCLLAGQALAGQTPPPGSNGQPIMNSNGLWGAFTNSTTYPELLGIGSTSVMKGTVNAAPLTFSGADPALFEMTSPSPATNAGSVLRISKYDNSQVANCVNKFDGSCSAGATINVFGVGAEQVQTTGLFVQTTNASTQTNIDSNAISANAVIIGTTQTGFATGLYSSASTVSTVGGLANIQLQSANLTGTNGTYSTTGIGNFDGEWNVAYSDNVHTNYLTSAYHIDGTNLGSWFSGFTINHNAITSTGYDIDDEGMGSIGLKMNGSHTYAIAIGTTAGSVGIGTLTPLNKLDVYTGGIHIGSNTPSNTTNALYAIGTSLYWNGATVGSGGGGSPGGSTSQLQYNNSGSFGGLQAFYAQAYGAVCDGAIIAAGVTTTSGSANIGSIAVGNGYPTRVFTSADIGATISISAPAQLNTPSSPSNNFTSTISSVSGGVATLAATVPFTTSGYQYASARLYHTTNTTALQAALTAGNATGYGGNIILPTGVCATGQLTFYPQQKISGAGPNSSILMLANGSNSDLLEGYNFASLTGSNTYGGNNNFVLTDFGLDGNKGQNTGGTPGSNTGTGDGLRFYGWGFYVDRVFVNNFATDSWYSEWNNGSGDPLSGINSENSYVDNMQFSGNAGYGMVWAGPHDSTSNNVTMTNCGTGGLLLYGYNQPVSGANGGTFTATNWHTYQCGTYDVVNQGDFFAYNSIFEGNVYDNSGGNGILLSSYQIFQNLTLGSGATKLQMLNGYIGGHIINNSSVGGSGDLWINNYVTNSTTNLAYQPSESIANIGPQGAAWGTTFPAGSFSLPGAFISTGTTFSVASGCGTVGSVTGGALTGSFTAGQTACAPVLTLPTAPNGWKCSASDITHPADTFTQTAVGTASCALSATVTNGDTIVINATGF